MVHRHQSRRWQFVHPTVSGDGHETELRRDLRSIIRGPGTGIFLQDLVNRLLGITLLAAALPPVACLNPGDISVENRLAIVSGAAWTGWSHESLGLLSLLFTVRGDSAHFSF